MHVHSPEGIIFGGKGLPQDPEAPTVTLSQLPRQWYGWLSGSDLTVIAAQSCTPVPQEREGQAVLGIEPGPGACLEPCAISWLSSGQLGSLLICWGGLSQGGYTTSKQRHLKAVLHVGHLCRLRNLRDLSRDGAFSILHFLCEE